MSYQKIALLTLLVAFVALGCAKEEGDSHTAAPKADSAATSKNNSIKSSSNVDGSSTGTPFSPDKTGIDTKPAPLRVPISRFVTDDTFGAVVIYPRELLADPLFSEVSLAPLIDEAMSDVGVSVTDLEEVIWLLSTPEKPRRTLVAARMTPSGPVEKRRARASEPVEPPSFKPPIKLDDLFEGLAPAKPVPPDEDRDFDSDPEFDPPPSENAASAEASGFHAFDFYWTPRFLPMIVRFAESSKADHFARLLTKDMSEIAWHDELYFKQEDARGKSPTICPSCPPAIQQYLILEPMSVYLPDAYTVVLATEPRLQAILNVVGASGLKSDTSVEFEKVLDSESATAGVSAVFDFGRLRESGAHESLLSELSEQYLSSRMALLNLADDAGLCTLKVDVSAASLIQLELMKPGDVASRERLSKAVANVVSVVADREKPQLKTLGVIVDELAKGISIQELETKIAIRTERPKQLATIPPMLAALLEQVVSEAEEALWRHSLEQIAFAMESYAAEHKRLPAAASYDETGKPMLSWRVHLLPYLGHEDLYDEFHLDEAWNSTHNITLLDRMPSVYGKAGADTRVLVFIGPGTSFDRDRESTESVFTSDHAGSTILLARTEEAKPVAWTEPKDLDISNTSPEEVLGIIGDSFLAAFCDGTVRYVVPSHEPIPLGKMVRPNSH